LCIFGDPVVRRIQLVRYDNPFHPFGIARDCHVTVGNQHHRKVVTLGDAVDFSLHRTGIGVDKNADRIGFSGHPFSIKGPAPFGKLNAAIRFMR
jgi:hypothetical protein